MRRGLVLPALLLGPVCGCPQSSSSESMDAKSYDYTQAPASDPKALVYNLVGRWYPTEEIMRLDNDSMTPDDWCAREPEHMTITLDDLELWCKDGKRHEAQIARVEKTDEGGIKLILRAPEEAKFKHVTFSTIISKEDEKYRPWAMVSGTPCTMKPEPVKYARFPRIEILERQILDGRSCTHFQNKK